MTGIERMTYHLTCPLCHHTLPPADVYYAAWCPGGRGAPPHRLTRMVTTNPIPFPTQEAPK